MKLRGFKFMLAWFGCTILVAIVTWICDLIFEYIFGHPSLEFSHRSFTEAGLIALAILLAFGVYGDKTQ